MFTKLTLFNSTPSTEIYPLAKPVFNETGSGLISKIGFAFCIFVNVSVTNSQLLAPAPFHVITGVYCTCPSNVTLKRAWFPITSDPTTPP